MAQRYPKEFDKRGFKKLSKVSRYDAFKNVLIACRNAVKSHNKDVPAAHRVKSNRLSKKDFIECKELEQWNRYKKLAKDLEILEISNLMQEPEIQIYLKSLPPPFKIPKIRTQESIYQMMQSMQRPATKTILRRILYRRKNPIQFVDPRSYFHPY